MENQRAAFEAWAENMWPNLRISRYASGAYLVTHIEIAWQAWQAAAEQTERQNDDDLRELVRQRARADRLERILDSRPAINMGLPETYIAWSRSIYEMDFAHARETAQ